MSVFLFVDQNAMNPIINDLVAEYGVGEDKIGIIGSAFIILGAVVSLIFGYLADKKSRKMLLAFVVLVGEIPCFLTGFEYFTRTYEQLLILRILTGLGIGGIFPLTFSLIGDYFPAGQRGIINAMVTTAWGVGQILGQTLAGFLSGPYGWRLPFIIAAVPNFVLVPLFVLVAREPKRGAQEEELSEVIEQGLEYREKIKFSDLKEIFKNKTNILGFLQGIPGSLPWGLIPFFIVPFYELHKGFSRGMATILSLFLGIGATVGGIFGGWMGDKIYKKSPRMLPVFNAVFILLGVIPGFFLMGLNYGSDPGWNELILPLIFSFCTGVVVSLPAPNIKSILINVNPPEHRGTVFSIHNLTDSLGRGVGPLIGGFLVVSQGYQWTMYFAVFAWIPCGLIYLWMYRTIDNDLDTLRGYLKRKREKIIGM
ncbi:MFS transporter [Halothermothrix orenii]|uniref:Major facilitator superfamily MFS_1 n=1 Tax=Halothermothrix orenii (strain H 168 / OCM 544 / DSM 9562) TaxID=373903 RepID=B8D212_HALOH|nr:MFS transporter [Halothermothrix orenii]ACL69239.1 major facilitator superfamily MFS_1 [Halothermothrix orenii H 168]